MVSSIQFFTLLNLCGVFQGKELDRLFKEEGVLEDDISDELKSAVASKDEDEVIGHLQTKEGEDLGELVILNKNSNRMLIKARGGIGTN